MTHAATLRGLLLVVMLAVLVVPGRSWGDGQPQSRLEVPLRDNLLLEARSIVRDAGAQTITAQGDVVVVYHGQTLEAAALSYHQSTGMLVATGGVTITDAQGTMLQVERLEIDDRFMNAVAEPIRLLLANNSRLTGSGARISDGDRTEVANGIYSSCEPCQEGSGPLLWEIKAKRIVHHKEERRVEYYHPRMEILGVPVLYAPYVSHPDPTVKRKTGFLTPKVGLDGHVGGYVRAPFFVDLAPDQNLVLEPVITEEHPLLLGAYEQALNQGHIKLNGSLTQADERKGTSTLTGVHGNVLQGHLDSDVRLELDDEWRTGLVGFWSHNDNYRHRYGNFVFDGGDYDESELFVEGFRRQHYMRFDGQYFDDTRTDERRENSIYVLPAFTYDGLGAVDEVGGGRWFLEAHGGAKGQSGNGQERSVRVDGGYVRPFLAGLGIAGTLEAGLRGDGVDTTVSTHSQGWRGESEVRAIPRASMKVQQPWVRASEAGQSLLTPQVVLHGIPDVGMNRDSLALDGRRAVLSDISLFDANRLAGTSRVETGSHGALGTEVEHNFNTGGRVALFAGRGYRFTDNAVLEQQAGLQAGWSDWFVQGHAHPLPLVDLQWVSRYDHTADRVRSNTVRASLGPSNLTFDAHYTYLHHDSVLGIDQYEEVSGTLSSQFSPTWRAFVAGSRDLYRDDSLSFSSGAHYDDECLSLTLMFKRSYIRNAAQNASDTIELKLTFKTLTE